MAWDAYKVGHQIADNNILYSIDSWFGKQHKINIVNEIYYPIIIIVITTM